MGAGVAGTARRVGWFKDGWKIRKCEIVGNGLHVTDALNNVCYETPAIPELDGYAVQEVGCIRLAQTGTLVVVIGGFYAGTSGQQSLMINTDYVIAEEITHEGYLAGQR